MNRKNLLTIILGITIIMVSIIWFNNKSIKYNKLVITSEEWNNITSTREESTNIELSTISFNDHILMIDNDNIIYYSYINTSTRFNPSVSYKTNNDINLVIDNKLSEELINQDSNIKVMIYNDTNYRIYNLVITDLPIINITTGTDTEVEIFDNHVDSNQRIIKSLGKVNKKDNNRYILSLFMESLGHNKRDNKISILGMDKHSDFILTKVSDDKDSKNVQLFIDNEYLGIYKIEERKVKNG